MCTLLSWCILAPYPVCLLPFHQFSLPVTVCDGKWLKLPHLLSAWWGQLGIRVLGDQVTLMTCRFLLPPLDGYMVTARCPPVHNEFTSV